MALTETWRCCLTKLTGISLRSLEHCLENLKQKVGNGILIVGGRMVRPITITGKHPWAMKVTLKWCKVEEKYKFFVSHYTHSSHPALPCFPAAGWTLAFWSQRLWGVSLQVVPLSAEVLSGHHSPQSLCPQRGQVMCLFPFVLLLGLKVYCSREMGRERREGQELEDLVSANSFEFPVDQSVALLLRIASHILVLSYL